MNTDVKRYYAVLEVDPSASEETIRIAFRRRAKELHPDTQSGDATAFILLKRAYDTLTDTVARAAYDRLSQPAPRPLDPVAPRPMNVRRQTYPLPPRPVHPPTAKGPGVSVRRYVIAFIIMAAISLGGVQAMISLTAAPPSIQTRAPASAAGAQTEPTTPAAAETPSAPGSTKSGFWDPGPTPTRPK